MNFTIYLISLFQFKDLGICSIEYLVIHKELAFISRSAPAEICHAAASQQKTSQQQAQILFHVRSPLSIIFTKIFLLS